LEKGEQEGDSRGEKRRKKSPWAIFLPQISRVGGKKISNEPGKIKIDGHLLEESQ